MAAGADLKSSGAEPVIVWRAIRTQSMGAVLPASVPTPDLVIAVSLEDKSLPSIHHHTIAFQDCGVSRHDYISPIM